MIPGTTSKLSESTVASTTSIDAKTDIVLVSGTEQIDTIVPHFGGGFSGLLVLVPIDGSVVLGTTGNISVGITAVIDRAVFLVYSRAEGLWKINSGV